MPIMSVTVLQDVPEIDDFPPQTISHNVSLPVLIVHHHMTVLCIIIFCLGSFNENSITNLIRN